MTTTVAAPSKYIQVRPDLFLTAIPVSAQVKVTGRPAVGHIWVVDRSGSMWTEIKPLIEDIKKKVRTLPAGDFFTLGWFSSEGGRFGFPLKGFKVTKNEEDFAQLDKLLDQYASTVALTCFSEVLTEVANVVLEQEPLVRVFSFMLFTDGYPVVSNIAKEEASIKASLEKLSSVVTSAQLVGYGDFYNKSLMADMARWVGGTLQHSSSLERTSNILQEFVDSQTGYRRIEFELPYALEKVFLIHGDRISQYEPFVAADGTHKVCIDQPEQNSYLYGVGSIRPAVGGKLTGEVRDKGLYGAALILNQSIQTDEAMAMLNLAEDPYLIDKLANAFNNEEYGRVERSIERAVFDKTYRYQGGRKRDYLPADDAFSLFDLMNLLMEDESAKFYPYSKDFKYKRVGPPSTPREGYPKFEPDLTGSYLSDLVWNQDQLNLNILTRTKGHIHLGPEAETYGLEEHYPTHIFRNYTVVRDGALWTQSLPVSVSNETYTQLVEKGVGLRYPSEPLEDSEGYCTSIVIDLTSIPIINRQTAKAAAKTTAAQLAEWALEELKLGGELKVAKALLEEIAPERPHIGSELTAVQQQFLESRGVGRNGFSPPSDRAETEDYYFAPTLSIKIKGFSALPSVNKIKEQMAAGKELKGPAAAMEATLRNLQIVKDVGEAKSTPAKTIEVLEAMISNLKDKQRLIRKHIQSVKFSIILGNQWFPNASSRDEVVETVEGLKVSIIRGQTKVNI